LTPSTLKDFPITVGLGDRLGLCSAAQVDALSGTNIPAVLAQQSKRELDFTGRTWKNVITDAGLGVFESGYNLPWGADADHIKNIVDVKQAFEAGFKMFTLDLSEKKTIDEMVNFIDEVDRITERNCDLEISIDEGNEVTTPDFHFRLARAIYDRGIRLFSVAPKFNGEFQKGIDYIGSLRDFEESFSQHNKIAEAFGYKISVHSGSDKFSIYPIIKKYAKRFHIKTSGTSWLEAVRTILQVDRRLYSDIYICARNNFDELKKFYHVQTDQTKITDSTNLLDLGVRQLFHITYGPILKNFKDRINATLLWNEDVFYENVKNNILKHLKCLGIDKK